MPVQLGRVLVTGGARSGKSHFAESLLTGAEPVDYVATSATNANDPEWVARIDAHRARRPASWRTIETLNLPAILADPSPIPVLVDCLGVWLTRLLDDCGFWADPLGQTPAAQRRINELSMALSATHRQVVLVTNEVGDGLVPETAQLRGFRDLMGLMNATVAANCDQVWLCVAGCPVAVKPTVSSR